jgi:hypothetical protein
MLNNCTNIPPRSCKEVETLRLNFPFIGHSYGLPIHSPLTQKQKQKQKYLLLQPIVIFHQTISPHLRSNTASGLPYTNRRPLADTQSLTTPHHNIRRPYNLFPVRSPF